WSILSLLIGESGRGLHNRKTSERHVVLSRRLDPPEVFRDKSFSRAGDGLTQALCALLAQSVQGEPKAKPLVPPRESARTRAIRAKLDQAIAMEFPNETPFADVLAYIKKATKKRSDDPGIPIYVDPLGLHDVGNTLTSVVRIDERGISLKV